MEQRDRHRSHGTNKFWNKMSEMHMKRHMPQIYISSNKDKKDDSSMNDFNVMLKKSLLTPCRQRYVTTTQEL